MIAGKAGYFDPFVALREAAHFQVKTLPLERFLFDKERAEAILSGYPSSKRQAARSGDPKWKSNFEVCSKKLGKASKTKTN